MIELAYTSTASWRYSTEDLEDILKVSREHNREAGITGILLYREDTVLQLLEGEAARVRALYAKLKLDRRHHSLTLLYDRPLRERRFGAWSMAFEFLTPDEDWGANTHRIAADRLIPDCNVEGRARDLVDTFVRHVR